MKKIKIIVAAIFRGIILLAPGTTFFWWAWDKVAALFSILATVGIETIYLFLFAFIVVAIKAAKDKAQREIAKEKSETPSKS